MSFLPQNSFYRTPRYSGGMNVPGAPGNLAADPSFRIPGGESPYRSMPMRQALVPPMGFQNKFVS